MQGHVAGVICSHESYLVKMNASIHTSSSLQKEIKENTIYLCLQKWKSDFTQLVLLLEMILAG